METEANEFASALLMPRIEVTIALRGGRLDIARLAALKPEWRVSMQALLYRAQSLGLIEKEKAASLWRKFAIERMKLREPLDLDFAPEVPGVVGRMIRLHLDTFGYSQAEFGKIMHANDKLLNQYYDLMLLQRLKASAFALCDRVSFPNEPLLPSWRSFSAFWR